MKIMGRGHAATSVDDKLVVFDRASFLARGGVISDDALVAENGVFEDMPDDLANRLIMVGLAISLEQPKPAEEPPSLDTADVGGGGNTLKTQQPKAAKSSRPQGNPKNPRKPGRRNPVRESAKTADIEPVTNQVGPPGFEQNPGVTPEMASGLS